MNEHTIERLSYFLEPESEYNATREEEAQYVRENMTLDWECLTREDSKISGFGGGVTNTMKLTKLFIIEPVVLYLDTEIL